MGFLRVTEPFTCFRTNPHGDTYTAGQVVDEKDAAVKGREGYFESVEDASARRANSVGIERATAAPGEKRDVSPAPAKKAAKKS